MDFYRHPLPAVKKATSRYSLIYAIALGFTFLTLFTAYSSSAYLASMVPTSLVGWIFTAGSALAILITIALPYFLRRAGNTTVASILMLFMCGCLFLIGANISLAVTIIAFIVYLAINPQWYAVIDVYLEANLDVEEGSTGRKRGLLLTLSSIAAFLAPLAMGLVVNVTESLASVYIGAALIGLCLTVIVRQGFTTFRDPSYQSVPFLSTIRSLTKNRDLSIALYGQFILQFFFTWAVIYIPLYLSSVLHFSWEEISYIIASGLFAFILFEYPIGILADTRYGEKEMMALGFTVITITVALMSAMSSASVFFWMLVMFVSRIGASLCEVTTESYYFKKVDGTSPHLITLFRITRPLANFIGAAIGSLTLLVMPLSFSFLVLSVIIATGVYSTLFLTDSR